MKPIRPVLPLSAFSLTSVLFAGIAMMFLFTPAGANPALPAPIAPIFLSLLSAMSGLHIRSLNQRIDRLENALAERDGES